MRSSGCGPGKRPSATRWPSLIGYVARNRTRIRYQEPWHQGLAVGSGAVKIDVAHSYPLKDARKAHEELESRGTTGSLILVP